MSGWNLVANRKSAAAAAAAPREVAPGVDYLRMCMHGTHCEYGSKCTFAHSEYELETGLRDEKLRWEEAVARRKQRLALAEERRQLAEHHACVPLDDEPEGSSEEGRG